MREDLLAAQPIHRFLGAEDWAAERVVGPERGHENLMNEIVRRVLDHFDFFEDHRAHRFQVGIAESRRDNDVGQQIERGIDLLIEHVCVKRRVFLAGERVDVAAEDVDDLGDVAGRSRRRALEYEVLEKMRRAAVLLRLDGRTAAQVIPQRDRADVRKGLNERRHPGRQHVTTYGRRGLASHDSILVN